MAELVEQWETRMSLIGRWTFSGMSGPFDETQNWKCVEFHGARLTHRGLEVGKGAWARVRPIDDAAFSITEKTLISWLVVNDLADPRPGGSALTLDAVGRDNFDGIVLGETADAVWTAGSTSWLRTQSAATVPVEKQTGVLVKMAVSYRPVGSSGVEVKLYRNDQIAQTYSQSSIASWRANDVEVLFGSRHTPSGDDTRGYLNATIVAAEVHDRCLSDAEIAARRLTDPCTFIRRTMSLTAVNFPDRYLAADANGSRLQLLPLTSGSDTDTKGRATVALVPGLADPKLVSLQMSQPPGTYLVTTPTGVMVGAHDGSNAFRARATFTRKAGLAGTGWSFESLSQPGCYLRHKNFVLGLEKPDSSDLFNKDASFVEADALAPEITTEMPLDAQSWYLISNHYANPAQVLGLRPDGVVDLVDLPTTGNIDHTLWRLERNVLTSLTSLHRWRLINKKSGTGRRLDGTEQGIWIGDDHVGWTGQSWTIRPIPWMGSDYFSMTNAVLEAKGSTLDCGMPSAGKSGPRTAPLHLDQVGQRWRFTFISFADGVERPSPPSRIKSVFGSTKHEDYVETFPKYVSALGMDYVATASTSDWAVAMARTVLTNVLLNLRDRSKVATFENYRILIVGDGDGDEASNYPDINNPEFPMYRGFTDSYVARITEEMMCRTGVTNRPGDKDYRKYDQTVHEFGHTIDRLLDLGPDLTKAQGLKPGDSYNVELFPWWVQAWFSCAMSWGKGGTRPGFDVAGSKESAFVKTLFRRDGEWFPYEVKYVHGSPKVT